MDKRRLGELEVSALGLGCMPMSGIGTATEGVYGKPDRGEAIATIHRALDLGVTFFDTAEMYGPFKNEELVGEALRGHRDGVVIATKFAMRWDGDRMVGIDGSAENARRACEGSLKRLGVETIDLFYQHRVDPKTPIEETMEGLVRLKEEGKIRHIGLSEAAPATIRRAHAVHPVTALQSEYSLWEREVEGDVLPLCRELGIGFVPYSPLGRGFLTGAFARAEDLPEGDWRRHNPRFQGENFDRNLRLVEGVQAVAARKGVSAAQVALAWLLAQGPDIVPIPGSKRRATLEDSMAAVSVQLSADDLAELERVAPVGAAAGDRYPEAGMRAVRL